MIRFIVLGMLLSIVLERSSIYAQHLPDSMLSKKDYFRLQEYLNAQNVSLPDITTQYYQCILSNFFNKPDSSSALVTSMLNKQDSFLTKERVIKILGVQIDNMVKLYRYREAYQYSMQLLQKGDSVLTNAEKENVQNAAIIWKALSGAPAQQTYVVSETEIPFIRDTAGLINIVVNDSSGTSSCPFVFDTGANISVISDSLSKKMGLRKIGAPFKVKAITGKEINAYASVCNTLRLGSILINNVVFMIFPDSALTFGKGYRIYGILGFPIIEQLGEFTISRSGKIRIPKQAQPKPISNFGLEQLTPVIRLATSDDTLAFTFDTGAQATILNVPFYDKYRQFVESTGTAADLKMGGAGGYTALKGYEIPEVVLIADGKPVILANIKVKTKSVTEDDKYYYGNIGQDFIGHFDEFTVNFKYMYVNFQ